MGERHVGWSRASQRTLFWVIRLLVFVAFFDLFVQYPIAAPYATTLGAGPALVGLIVAAYSMANLGANLVAGALLDRWGRSGPLLASFMLTALTVACYALVSTPGQLLGLRLVHGVVVAVLAPGAFALVGDLAPPEQRGRLMGTNGAMIALAAIVAPAVAGILQERAGYAAVFLLDALVLTGAGIVFLGFWKRVVRSGPVQDREPSATGGWSGLIRQEIGPFATILAFAIALGIFVTHVPERLEFLGIPASVRGAAFSTYGILAALVMISPLPSRFLRRAGLQASAAGLSLISIGLLVASAVRSVSPASLEQLTLIGAAIFGIGFGLLFPTVAAEAARRSPPGMRGRAFGVFYALYSLGVVLGALASGWLTEFVGRASGWPLVAGAAVAALACVVPFLERRTREEVAL